MTDPQLKGSSDLREFVIGMPGGNEHLMVLDGVLADNARFKELEASISKKAHMLRNGFWDISDETGVAGEIHAAITELHIGMEGIAEQRDQLREKLVQDVGTV